MSKEKSSGVGLGTVLFLIFLVLKLIGVIDWSWWWVTSPLWIGLMLLIVVAILTVIFILLKSFFKLNSGK